MLDTTFEVANPEAVVFRLTLEMTLGEFLSLRKQLNATPISERPARVVVNAIDSMTIQAKQSFYPIERESG